MILLQAVDATLHKPGYAFSLERATAANIMSSTTASSSPYTSTSDSQRHDASTLKRPFTSIEDNTTIASSSGKQTSPLFAEWQIPASRNQKTSSMQQPTPFMFIPFNGQHKPRHHTVLQQTIRRHVMHHSLDQQREALMNGELGRTNKTKNEAIKPTVSQPKAFRVLLNGTPKEKRSAQSPRSLRPAVVTAKKNSVALRAASLQQCTAQAYANGSQAQQIQSSAYTMPVPISPPCQQQLAHAVTDGTSTSDILNSYCNFVSPYAQLPFTLTHRSAALLSRFESHLSQSWCPISARGPWLPYALHSELLFDATMFHWSCKVVGPRLHRRRCEDTDNSINLCPTAYTSRNASVSMADDDETQNLISGAIDYKIRAIRSINERLSQLPMFCPLQSSKPQSSAPEGSTIEIIAAVSVLINAGVSLGNLEEVKRHVDGLTTLINLCGGMLSLSEAVGGVLLKFVKWNNLLYERMVQEDTPNISVMTDQQSHFPYVGSTERNEYASNPKATWGHPTQQPPAIHNAVSRPSTPDDSLSTSVMTFFRHAGHLYRNRASSIHDTELELSTLHVELESNLTALSWLNNGNGDNNSWDSMLGAAMAVGLVYMLHIEFELGHWVATTALDTFSNNNYRPLRPSHISPQDLSENEPATRYKQYPLLLIRALTVACVLPSFAVQEHNAFRQNLVKACQEQGLRTWSAYNDKLQGFFWYNFVDGSHYVKVWSEVERLIH